MKTSSLILVLNAFFCNLGFAGGSLGGGGASQLQEIALSETMLSPAGMDEILGNMRKPVLGSLETNLRARTLMEANSEDAAGILIEVQHTDFDIVARDAANGKDFVYRDAAVRATSIDPASNVVIMTMIDDPSVAVVVKGTGNE